MKFLLLATVFLLWFSGFAAPFRNLGFDADVDSTEVLLPGWQIISTVANTNRVLDRVGYDIAVLDAPSFIGDPNVLSTNNPYHYPVEGKFALELVPVRNWTMTISQKGDIPPDAKTIYFIDLFTPFELKVNGAPIPLFYDYVNWSPPKTVSAVRGDVSTYAGQNVELSFTTVPNVEVVPFGFGYDYGIDSISFSPEAIPEPSSLILSVLGGMSLFLFRQFKTSARPNQRHVSGEDQMTASMN